MKIRAEYSQLLIFYIERHILYFNNISYQRIIDYKKVSHHSDKYVVAQWYIRSFNKHGNII